jgi:hypothetical protein
MQIQIKSVRNPIWSNNKKTAIDCIIKTNHLKEEVPFTASPNDPETYGKQLFEELITGKYGKIKENTKAHENINIQKTNKQQIDNTTLELIKFIETANRDLTLASPRNLIILWSSKLEYILRQFLITKNINFTKQNPTFNDFNKLMKKYSYFDKNDFECAENIRKIRNISAHHWDFTLNTKDKDNISLRSYIKNLYNLEHSKLFEENFEDLEYMIKMFFTSSCARLIMKFI